MKIILILFAMVLLIPSVFATTVQLDCTNGGIIADTYVNKESSGTNYGTAESATIVSTISIGFHSSLVGSHSITVRAVSFSTVSG